jgi:cytochrome c biogenesis protein CcmG/thiol:disulfide interchange protein DsbE
MSVTGSIRRRHALVVAVAVGVVAVGLISVLATRGVAPAQDASTSLGGRSAPSISGADLLTGRSVTLSSLRGKYVVVNFFASWCGPCQTESPALEAFQFAHRSSRDATVLGVVYDDSTSNAKAFLSRTGATWPAVDDPGATIAVNYGVSAPPRTFVVAPDGKVISNVYGAVTEALLNSVLIANGGSST